jgi:hypothetical protein
MDFHTLGRMVSLLVAFVVLFGLEMAFQAAIYIAITAGIAAYTVSRLVFALLTPQDSKPKS